MKQNNQNNTVDKPKRKFIKKAVWSIPKVIIIKELVKPTKVYADTSIPNPPDGGDGWW